MVEQRRFSRSKEAGKDGDGEFAGGWHKLFMGG